MLSRIAATGATLAFLLAVPREAIACECISVGTREEQYSAYRGMIVVGRVVKLELLPNSNVLRVELRVAHVLRGTWTQDTMTGYAGLGASCLGSDFRIGQEYAVFPGQLSSVADFVRHGLLNLPSEGLWFGGICGGGYTLDLRVPNDVEMLRKVEASLPPR